MPKKGEVFSRHCASPSVINGHFCQNNQNAGEATSRNETDLVVQDLLEEQSEDTYTDESDDDLDEFRREEMEDDTELRALMEFVFGPESDKED